MFRSLLNALSRVQTSALELLFPTRCVGCDTPPELLCNVCKKAIHYRKSPRITEDVYAAVAYRHPATEQLVWTFKYKGDKRAGEILAELLWESCGELIADQQALSPESLILAGIPSAAKERRQRTINHTETLIQQFRLAYLDNQRAVFIPGLLTKTIHTPPQMTLTREERLRNLVGTFSVRQPEQVKDKTVLVFDDVTTTGATFAEAQRALFEAGAKEVVCVAVAH